MAAEQAITRAIEMVTKTIEQHAADRSWTYAKDAAVVVWQLSRALGELPASDQPAEQAASEEGS